MKKMIIISLTLVLVIAMKIDNVNAKTTEIGTPKNLIVWCKDSHTLKLKWSKVDNATGYKIYRYQKSKKKYKVIKTLGAKKCKFTDKNLKIHKIYKYKIVAFRKKKNRKEYGEKTYYVSARTYGEKARIVNVAKGKSVKIYKQNKEKEIGICSTESIVC